MSKIRTRIAPSPTGFLHVGTARTALFNYLFAKHTGGELILRIEDTDLERSKKKFEKDIIEGLKWLGIEWNEEITLQSERIDIYEKYLKKLLDDKKAFYCPHSEKELDMEHKEQLAQKHPSKHICDARDKNLKDGIIRFKNTLTGNKIAFADEIRGNITFEATLFGDFSLAKDTRTPLYNFAVVVDDYKMEISHVIRGEDHISNTPKQILIQQALEFDRPIYAHLPLILGSDRSKLSKRNGATSLSEYREAGYLPETLLNFLAILGWNAGDNKEIFSKEELIKKFSLERIQKAGAIFDVQKLDWMNGEYIRKKSPLELAELATHWLGDFIKNKPNFLTKEKITQMISLEQPRLKKLSELTEKTDYFFKEPQYEAVLLKWKKMTNEEITNSLKIAKELLQSVNENEFTKENLEKLFLERAKSFKDKGWLLWPLRVALTGKKSSSGPFEIMEILGPKTSISRVDSAVLSIF